MEAHIQSFTEYLHNRKNTSYNTEISYQRDLKKLNEYLKNRGISGPEAVREADLQAYLKELKNENYASATVSRNTATIRAFFQYLLKQGILKEDPSENLKPPKVEKKMPRVLSIQEVDRILELPDVRTAKGVRDKAMLELLYATGMRVSELIHMKLEDVNLQLGYVVCRGNQKERIIPIGNTCRDLLAEYIENGRYHFVRNRNRAFYKLPGT